MWHEGKFDLNGAGYRWCAKVYDEPSEDYGIEGGRISKLEIRRDGETVCNYDRGWDNEPEIEQDQQAFAIVLHMFN